MKVVYDRNLFSKISYFALISADNSDEPMFVCVSWSTTVCYFKLLAENGMELELVGRFSTNDLGLELNGTCTVNTDLNWLQSGNGDGDIFIFSMTDLDGNLGLRLLFSWKIGVGIRNLFFVPTAYGTCRIIVLHTNNSKTIYLTLLQINGNVATMQLKAIVYDVCSTCCVCDAFLDTFMIVTSKECRIYRIGERIEPNLLVSESYQFLNQELGGLV